MGILKRTGLDFVPAMIRFFGAVDRNFGGILRQDAKKWEGNLAQSRGGAEKQWMEGRKKDTLREPHFETSGGARFAH